MTKRDEAWVISVDMGYGHQRAAYPLKDIAHERIITANSDKVITPKERRKWVRFRAFYEGISRLRSLPLIGESIWRMYDSFQKIAPFYPFRDLSSPNVSAYFLDRSIHKGFMQGLISHTLQKDLPLVTTFFVPALAASHAGKKDVYCIVTDSDISRIWAPRFPKEKSPYYCIPTEHTAKRLAAYGIPIDKIIFTGFPLPKENTGKDLRRLKHDLGNRLPNLDPTNIFRLRYSGVLKKQLGKAYRKKSDHPLTILFSVGGAGAQKEIGAELLSTFKPLLQKRTFKLILAVGTRMEIEHYFISKIQHLGLTKEIGRSIFIICTLDKVSYFNQFNAALHKTDILWTKPSELSFYTALGLPIMIAPALGSHEQLNQKWLTLLGAGVPQENPTYAAEWLFDWLNKGLLAEAAWNGYLKAPKYGTYNIENVVFNKKKPMKY